MVQYPDLPERGQIPKKIHNFNNIQVADAHSAHYGEYKFPPVVQNSKDPYFSFLANKTRYNSYTGGSHLIEIHDNVGGAFQLNSTNGSGSSLPANFTGSTSAIYFSTSLANTSYIKNIHVIVRKDIAPGTYFATLKVRVVSKSFDYPQGQSEYYEIPLSASVLPNHVMQLKVGDTVHGMIPLLLLRIDGQPRSKRRNRSPLSGLQRYAGGSGA